MSDIPIREWVKKFDAGEFNAPDFKTQCEAGWYDWFCKDSALARKTQKLGRYLKTLLKTGAIDVDNSYVFFKNNCPGVGTLYDDLRVCDLATGEVIWTIVPKSGHRSKEGRAGIYGSLDGTVENRDFSAALAEGTKKDIVAFLQGVAARKKVAAGA